MPSELIYPIVESYIPTRIDDLNKMSKKIKFLFANTDNWIEETKNIICTDISMLKKNGTVLVACSGNTKPDILELNSDKIKRNIAKVIPEKMKINSAINNEKISKQIKFKHIDILQRNIANKEHKFVDVTATNIERKLKSGFKNVL